MTWEHIGWTVPGGADVFIAPAGTLPPTCEPLTHEDVRYEGGCCDGTVTVTLHDVPVERDPEGVPWRTGYPCGECGRVYSLERTSPYGWKAPPGERDG